MKRSGVADLPLHGGRVSAWLAMRMTTLGTAIAEAVVHHYGPSELLTRLSDPFWFQALGSVMGMDWHSSGITTSVMGALKRGLNPRAEDLGIYICGGRGKHSRRTPDELRGIAERIGLNGQALVETSRLTARIDNNAIADGFQIYLHSFILTRSGEWAVVQQGLNPGQRTARRYHWHSATVRDFTAAPHTAIVGEPTGVIQNLVDIKARPAQETLVAIAREHPDTTLRDVRTLLAPRHHDVRAENVDLRRLGAVLAVAYERDLRDFASLLLSTPSLPTWTDERCSSALDAHASWNCSESSSSRSTHRRRGAMRAKARAYGGAKRDGHDRRERPRWPSTCNSQDQMAWSHQRCRECLQGPVLE
jgi:hypothetical protein